MSIVKSESGSLEIISGQDRGTFVAATPYTIEIRYMNTQVTIQRYTNEHNRDRHFVFMAEIVRLLEDTIKAVFTLRPTYINPLGVPEGSYDVIEITKGRQHIFNDPVKYGRVIKALCEMDDTDTLIVSKLRTGGIAEDLYDG